MRRLAAVFFLVLLALPFSAAGDARAQRLFDLGRVWTAVKWFHPYLAYRNDIDWDAAGMRAIARAGKAKNADEYIAAIEEMLAPLGDPSTRVIRARRKLPPPDAARERHPATTLRDDGILVARIRYYEDFNDFTGAGARIEAMIDQFAKAKAIVFDLRPLDVDVPDGRAIFTFRYLATMLTKDELLMPSIRSRMHEGFVPESGSGGSRGYASSFVTTDAARTTPAPKDAVSVPVVFLLNEIADFPPIAIALQNAGRGAVVVHGDASDAMIVPTARFDLADGVQVAVRTGEIVNPDGTVGFTPRLLLPRETSDGDALDKAIELAKNFTAASPAARTVATPATPRKPPAYDGEPYPSAEARVLAGWKIWSIFEHFFPYRDLMGDDWDAVVQGFLPRLEAAKDATEYHLTIAELLTHTHDSHVAASSDVLGAILGGQAVPPVMVRMIEDQMVVVGFYDEPAAREAGLKVGDVITAVNGEDVKAGLARMARYVPASTPQSLGRVGSIRLISSTKDGEVTLTVNGRDVKVPRKRAFWNNPRTDRPGEIVRILDGNIGYADLARLEVKDVDAMFEKLRETKAIIFDNRGYPRGTAWSLAPRLTEKPRFAAALFDRPIATLRGDGNVEETLTNRFLQYPPRRTKWAYTKPTYMLIDERAISQAEHTALFFRAANGTKFIGSPTTGANGDVTSFFVPGGIRISFSGQSVRWPDGRQLQRVGVQPDVLVRPTIAGIRAGKDEVLEKALEVVNAEVK